MYKALLLLAMAIASVSTGQIDPSSELIDGTFIENIDAENINEIQFQWHDILDKSSCFSWPEKNEIKLMFSDQEKIISWYQLQAIDGLDLESIRCFIKETDQGVQLETRGEKDEKHRFLFSTKNILNSSPSILMKFKGPIGNQSRYGLLLEKDESENYWTATGPDYLSLFYEKNMSKKIIHHLIIGDYRIRIGQGLLVNNFFRKGLTFGDLQIPQWTGRKVMPYQSLDENRGFRGTALSWRLGKLNGIAFVSYRQMDASVDTAVQNRIQTFQYSGLHISESQLNNKDQVRRSLYGTAISYQKRSFQFSLNTLFDHRSLEMNKVETLHKSLNDTSRLRVGASLDHQLSYKNLQWYGELAIQHSGSYSFLQGLLWNPHREHRFSFLTRGKSIGFDANLAQSFFQSSYRGNEYGIFAGYQFRPHRRFQWIINADQWIYPWWTYLQSPFRQGFQISSNILWKKRRKYSCRLTMRLSGRDQRQSNEETSMRETQMKSRIHFIKNITTGIEWRARLEWNYRSIGVSKFKGFLHYQEIKIKPLESSWEGLLRLAIFHTDGYEGRVYAYTHRLGGVFSIPAYFGSGIQTYLLLRKRFNKFSASSKIEYSIGQEGFNSIIIGTNISFIF